MLRSGVFESIGLTNVETVIAGATVVFDAKARNTETLEKKLQTTLENDVEDKGQIAACYSSLL